MSGSLVSAPASLMVSSFALASVDSMSADDPEIVNFAGGGSDAVTAESAVDADEIRETVPPLPPQLRKEPCESDVGVGERYLDRAAFDADQHELSLSCGSRRRRLAMRRLRHAGRRRSGSVSTSVASVIAVNGSAPMTTTSAVCNNDARSSLPAPTPPLFVQHATSCEQLAVGPFLASLDLPTLPCSQTSLKAAVAPRVKQQN